jgi:hypothetical protein
MSEARRCAGMTHLVWFIEDGKLSFIFVLWSILEILNVLTDNLPVGDQESLSIDHVRDHHDLIRKLIGKLEWVRLA